MGRCDDANHCLVCEDTENFNDWSDHTEASVESIDDDRISIGLSSRVISSAIFEWSQQQWPTKQKHLKHRK
jgi:hypothetical protein